MDSYGVTPADIAAELPGLFVSGFTQSTKPSLEQVTTWISRADTRVSVAAAQLENSAPSAFAQAVPGMAKDYIIEFVKGKVLQAIYAANPVALAAILPPQFSAAKDALQALKDLAVEIEEEVDEGATQPLRASESTPNVFVW